MASERYCLGMRVTMDKVGRVVIPKPLRDQVGFGPGVLEVTAEGAGLRLEPLAGDRLDERGGRLVIPPSGEGIVDDAAVRALRDADRR